MGEVMTTEEMLKHLVKEVEEIKDRLFIDNGRESIQSKINRHERWIKILSWVAVASGGSLITIATTFIIRHFS